MTPEMGAPVTPETRALDLAELLRQDADRHRDDLDFRAAVADAVAEIESRLAGIDHVAGELQARRELLDCCCDRIDRRRSRGLVVAHRRPPESAGDAG